VEEGLFLRGRFAAEDRIAMRKATEARNDVAMLHGISQALRESRLERREQLHAPCLGAQAFGMHHRQIKELAQRVVARAVEAARYRALSHPQRDLVGCESVRRAAVDIARHLIE